MTDKEAIDTLERYFDKSCGDYRYQNKQKIDTEEAVWIAISALKERDNDCQKLRKCPFCGGETECCNSTCMRDEESLPMELNLE